MAKILGIISNEGLSTSVYQDIDGRVHFVAGATIDADGANGQNGGPAAYKVDDSGLEALENGGMTIENGKVVASTDWACDVVIVNEDGEPCVFPGGIIASKAWYQIPGKEANDPSAYVDAATVPYVVVPPLIISQTVGIVRGCRAKISYDGQSIECVVADQGPPDHIGEISIAAADALGIPSDPRTGGISEPVVSYEIWPGQAAPGFILQRA